MPLSHLSHLYSGGFGLLTDFYQLTMAYAYWKTGLYRRRATFHLFYRKPPFGGDFALAAGLPLALDLIENFRFSVHDIQYLGGLRHDDGSPVFSEPFLNYLQRMTFTGDVYAIEEGEAVFPNEPLLRVEAPLPQAQLLETALLTVMNFSTLIATKSARICAAAGADPVLEFGLRRAQGPDGGLTASRAAFLGGCAASSNVWAGRYYGIPVRGTHAHSWVMAFGDELESFRQFGRALPQDSIFLVDTYDTVEGIRRAIEAGRELEQAGYRWGGIRLDSGDLTELSRTARRMMDEAGFPQAAIVASNDLDEYRIRELKERGAAIGVWGVGTRLATAYEQPALGGVYKLSAISDEDGRWQYRIKRSEELIKINDPGRLQVRRLCDDRNRPLGSYLYDVDEGSGPGRWIDEDGRRYEAGDGSHSRDLLLPVIRQGQRVYDPPALRESRDRARAAFARYSEGRSPDWSRGMELQLHTRKVSMLQELEKETL